MYEEINLKMITKKELSEFYSYITNIIIKKRKSTMLLKVTRIFDIYCNRRKGLNNLGQIKILTQKGFNNFDPNKNYDSKFMEWQDDGKDRCSSKLIFCCKFTILLLLLITKKKNIYIFLVHSLSWAERNALEKSKSDSSITAIGDCNYRTQGIQVSLENCDAPRNDETLALDNLDINEDDDEMNETVCNFKSMITKDCNNFNQTEYNNLRYGFKTQDITTKQLIVQGPEILNFQV